MGRKEMSVVTGIMLILGVGDWEEEPLQEVQSWLAERDWPPLADVSEHASGSKHPQFEAWSAGVNYFLDEEDFAQFAMTRKWRDPGNLVLVLQPEEGPSRVYLGSGV